MYLYATILIAKALYKSPLLYTNIFLKTVSKQPPLVLQMNDQVHIVYRLNTKYLTLQG